MSSTRDLREAQALLTQGDVAGAERMIAGAYPDPKQAPALAHYLMGLVRLAQQRLGDARRCLAAAVVAEPTSALYHFTLGDLLARLGEYASAAEFFAEAASLDPAFPNAQRAYARAALNGGDATAAEAAARDLIAAQGDADAWDILSCALRLQDRDDEALAAAEQALARDPGSVPAHHDWAVAAGKLGRGVEALAAFERLSARGVVAPALSLNHGGALLEAGRIGEAEALLAAAIDRWPQDAALHSALAKARWLGGAGEAFTSRFEQAIARNPQASALRAMCVDLLRVAGFAEHAEALLQKGLALRPSDPVLTESLGVLFEDAGRLDEAEPLLAQACTRTPGAEELRALWLRALLRQGRAADALEALKPLRADAPYNQLWIALESLALRQLGHGRYHWLCDYDAMVQAYALSPPPGYRTIAAFNQALAASLAKLHVARGHPLGQTLRGGTQSGPSLTHLDDPIIKEYLVALQEPIRAYTARMHDRDHPWSGRNTGAFKLSGAWTVRLFAGGHHVNHVHPKGWISSAYYVSLPDDMDASESHAGWIKFGEPPKPMPGCGVEKLVKPEAGKLVLFPSYMWHGTVPFAHGERLTAPFDVVPV